jgi:hypothetical protein
MKYVDGNSQYDEYNGEDAGAECGHSGNRNSFIEQITRCLP